MANIKIKDATLINELTDEVAFPVSDGTNTAKKATIGQVKEFVGGGSDKIVFFDLPSEESWEDEEVTRPFYNSLKSAIDDGKYVVVIETLEGDFDCWLYYTVAYNAVDSDEEDQEWIGLQVFDGTYTYAIEVTPTNITRTEREIKSDIEIEFDKTDINSVYNQLLSNFITANPVLFEEVEHADYYWKFINAEAEEDTGAITGFVFLCNKKGELHKLVIEPYNYQDVTISTQVSEMPTANADNVGQIIQYIGTTDTSYTNGYFYRCTESSGTYSWQNINVQAGGSGGGDAETITYDNTDSGLIATNVQDAIDEVTSELSSKVDKEEGKGLSTNDLTDERKNKLDNMPALKENFDGMINITDEQGNILSTFDSQGQHIKRINIYDEANNIIGEIDANFFRKVQLNDNGIVLLGDSTMNVPRLISQNWSVINNRLVINEDYGGCQAPYHGAYIGAFGLKLKENTTIPASKDEPVQLSIDYSLTDKDGEPVTPLFLGLFDDVDNANRKGLNPVSINGIEGILSGKTDAQYASVALYDASQNLLHKYNGNNVHWGNGKTWTFSQSQYNVKYIRIAINAFSADDVARNTCHFEINDTSVDLTNEFTNANKSISTVDGSLRDEIGSYATDLIDVSSLIQANNTVYNDGLGTPAVTFQRTTSGDEQVVEKGTFIRSRKFKTFSNKQILIYYLNNVDVRVGYDTYQECVWAQIEPILRTAKDGMFIFAITHNLHRATPFGVTLTPQEIEDFDNFLADKLGNKYINMYKYLSTCGIQDGLRYGLFTQQEIDGYDWEQVLSTGSQGEIGGSWNTHENRFGAYLIFRKFIETAYELGYIDSVGNLDFETLWNNEAVYSQFVPWYKRNI